MFAIIIWYFVERNVHIGKIEKLESEACNELSKIISKIKSLNFDIIERLSYPSIEETKKVTVLKKNLTDLESIFEKSRNVLDTIHEIDYLTDNSGWFFSKSYDYSYISHQLSLIESFDTYSFYLKYKDAKIIDDIKKYREDWIDLYAHPLY